jgi:hypothetical protein
MFQKLKQDERQVYKGSGNCDDDNEFAMDANVVQTTSFYIDLDGDDRLQLDVWRPVPRPAEMNCVSSPVI